MPQLSNTPQGVHLYNRQTGHYKPRLGCPTHHRECIYMTKKSDTIGRDSVSRIKDLDIPKASGSTYHGSGVSFDFVHRATTSKMMIAPSAVVTIYHAVRATVGGFSITMEAHLRAIIAKKRRIEPIRASNLMLLRRRLDHASALPYVLGKTNFRGTVFMTHPTKAIYKWLVTAAAKLATLRALQVIEAV